MSEQIKYEAVFGDQALFDDVDHSCEGISTSGRWLRFNYSQDGIVEAFDDDSKVWVFFGVTCTVIAMRRIIQEPKRWTVEDQKAGRLPEVGAELLHESEGYVNFVGEFDFRWMLRTKEGGLYLAEKFYCSPIETPEEKAERLREEWCIKALSSCSILSGMQNYELKRLGGYIKDIYDALLSGDLSTPKRKELINYYELNKKDTKNGNKPRHK